MSNRKEVTELAIKKINESEVFCVVTTKDGVAHIDSYNIDNGHLSKFFESLAAACRNRRAGE